MIDALMDLTAELRARAPEPPAPGVTQLLGCTQGWGLFRDAQGLHHRALATLPAEAGPFDLSPLIDHTLLKADATPDQVATLCHEARDHGFASVCVNSAWVPLATTLLRDSPVRVCTVVGFPLGASLSEAKAAEARAAVKAGAREVDMVLSVGHARAGDWEAVAHDLAVVRRAVPAPTVLKVILETCLLDDAQKARACDLAREAGLDFVKTSTGFSTGGATEADIALMRRQVGLTVGVKASGGIRTYGTALAMVKAGASRLGLSASLAVVAGSSGSGSGGY